MNRCIAKDFQKLESIEKNIIATKLLTERDFSMYAFSRPALFKLLSRDSNIAVKNNKSILLQFIYLPIFFIKLIVMGLYKRNKGLVFCTERNDDTNSCRYINTIPSAKDSNYLKLRYSINHKPRLFDNVIDIAPLILIIKGIARVNLVNKYDLEKLKKINDIFLRDHDIDCSEIIKNKASEFRLLSAFFMLLIVLSNPKRIIFVSNNFFIPLINIAKTKSIPTYEVAHALAHEYHPNYSYKHFTKSCFYPDYLIESELAFNIENNFLMYKKIFFNKKRKDIEKTIKEIRNNQQKPISISCEELFNSNKKNILIIGQGPETDEILLNKIHPFMGEAVIDKITFREHPAHIGKITHSKIKLSRKLLNEDIDDNDIILADYSQVMLIACLMNKEIVALNEYWFKAIDSVGIKYKKLHYD